MKLFWKCHLKWFDFILLQKQNKSWNPEISCERKILYPLQLCSFASGSMLWYISTILIKEIDAYPPHGICISLMVTVAGSHKEPNFSFSHCHEILCWPSVLTCVRAVISCSYKWIADTFFETSYITAWAVCKWKPVIHFYFTYTEEKEKEINIFWWKKLLKCSQLQKMSGFSIQITLSIYLQLLERAHSKDSKTKGCSKTQGYTSYWELLELHVKVTEGTKLLNLLF